MTRVRALSVLLGVLLLASMACADAATRTVDPGPLRGVTVDRFRGDLLALAGGAAPASFGSLDSGPVTEEFTRARAGAGLLAASLASTTGDRAMAQLSQRTWDYVLESSARPDGALGVTPDGDPDGVQTMFVGTALGLSIIDLHGYVAGPVLTSWADTLVDAATYLDRNGDTTFYSNGNVNIGYTLLYRLTAEVTGDPRWREVYERSLAFTLDPPEDRWEEYGLRITRQPTRADGSDGAGYLTERGQGGIGFDADYAQIQADQVARLYLVDRDPRVLRLLNLLVNGVLDRVDVASGTLDTSGGTRHPAAGRRVGFVSGSVAVLHLVGCRESLGATAVSLGRTTAASLHTAVVNQQTKDYGLFALGPPNMVGAVGRSAPSCGADPS